jgi:protein SCO1/2
MLERAVMRLHEGMSDHRFPAFLLSTIAFTSTSFAALVVWPASPTGIGAFAEEFRRWCFGYDPERGLEWAYVATLITGPALVAGLLLGLWWQPLARAYREHRRALLPAGAGGLCVAIAVLVGLGAFGVQPAAAGDEPFPGERLRTAVTPPAFALVDQDGQRVELAALRGRVVVLTGVYATCGFACPMILQQARRAVESVPAALREDLTVVAITLDPAHDTPERMTDMAAAQRVSAPRFRLVTGAPAEVDHVLDALGIERRRDPTTGILDHSNLFALVDRSGRIAYRFSLGELQERWLSEALVQLLREAPPAS